MAITWQWHRRRSRIAGGEDVVAEDLAPLAKFLFLRDDRTGAFLAADR
jgi:hypothetical protein